MQLNAELKQHMKTLRISEAANILDNVLIEAESKDFTYQEFLYRLINHEVQRRDEKSMERRLKQAAFPEHKTLDEFDINEQKSLSKKQLKQLRELWWLDQGYNLILLGPPGVGKTFIATGLGLEAVYRGYKVSFITMDDLVQVLKTQEITRKSKTKLKKIIDSDLVIIDDITSVA